MGQHGRVALVARRAIDEEEAGTVATEELEDPVHVRRPAVEHHGSGGSSRPPEACGRDRHRLRSGRATTVSSAPSTSPGPRRGRWAARRRPQVGRGRSQGQEVAVDEAQRAGVAVGAQAEGEVALPDAVETAVPAVRRAARGGSGPVAELVELGIE